MDDYNFWSDLLDTWQSTADWVKALAILTPQATALAALALVLRHRQARRRAAALPAGTLAYTLWRDGDDRLHVVRQDAKDWRTLSAGGEGGPSALAGGRERGRTRASHPAKRTIFGEPAPDLILESPRHPIKSMLSLVREFRPLTPSLFLLRSRFGRIGPAVDKRRRTDQAPAKGIIGSR